MASWLRIVGIIVNILGALILAVRMKGILDELVSTTQAHEINFHILVDKINGGRQVAPMIFEMTEHVARAHRRGIWLLVLGFACLALGNALVAVSWYMEAHGT